jgi:hypothetical protein
MAAPTAAPDALELETQEVASWQWLWGAFLWPGVWNLANRVRPKTGALVMMVLFGLFIAGFLIGTITTVSAAHAAENALAHGLPSPTYSSDTPANCWNEATMPAAWLLAFYIVACLCAISSAKHGALEAWRAFPSQRLSQFRTAQRAWAVSGVLLCASLIGLNVYIWNNYNRAQTVEWRARVQASVAASQVLASGSWVWRNPKGTEKFMLRFEPNALGGPASCSFQKDDTPRLAADYAVVGDRISIMTTSPSDVSLALSPNSANEFVLSEDHQTLTKIGGDARVYRYVQAR